MNSLKNVCMILVLAAILYGAYATLTSKSGAPVDNSAWENTMQVELPGGMTAPPPPVLGASAGSSAGSGPPPAFVPTAPAANAGPAPAFTPTSTYPSTPGGSATTVPEAPAVSVPAAPVADSSAPPYVPPQVGVPSNNQTPSTYPRTELADAAFDATRIRDAAVTTASFGNTPVAGGVTQAGGPSAHTDGQFQKAMEMVRGQLERSQLKEAHLALSEWYDDPQLSSADFERLVNLLDQLAGTVIYSRENWLEPAYTVQPGETLDRVAKTYNVPWELLAKINGVTNPYQLQPGTQLKVLRGPFDAVVDLEDKQLTLFLHGRYAGRFAIGVGRDRPLPTGQFLVQAKVSNPTYYGPDGVIDKDDPSNPLGERWIDLGNHVGIHGTNDPASLARDEARGCIRLAPRDIDDVFDILSEGSRVIVR